MDTSNEKRLVNAATDIFILLVLSGVTWGLAETVLGNLFRVLDIPLRTAFLTGAGMGIMGVFLGVTKKPLVLPLIAIVAAASVQLSAPILHCSLLCKANANLAVVLHGSMLSVFCVAAARRKRNGVLAFAAFGFGAALLSASAFYPSGLHLVPCAYLLSFGAQGGFFNFILREGLPWAICSAVLFPAGLVAGKYLLRPLYSLKQASPRQFYGGAFGMIMIGIIMIAASIQYWR